MALKRGAALTRHPLPCFPIACTLLAAREFSKTHQMHHFLDLKSLRGPPTTPGSHPNSSHTFCNLGPTLCLFSDAATDGSVSGLLGFLAPGNSLPGDAVDQVVLHLNAAEQHLESSLLPPTGPQKLSVQTSLYPSLLVLTVGML